MAWRSPQRWSAAGFTKMLTGTDPLKGAYGLAWYERKPTSLTQDEWKALDAAAQAGTVPTHEYFDWKLNVK